MGSLHIGYENTASIDENGIKMVIHITHITKKKNMVNKDVGYGLVRFLASLWILSHHDQELWEVSGGKRYRRWGKTWSFISGKNGDHQDSNG